MSNMAEAIKADRDVIADAQHRLLALPDRMARQRERILGAQSHLRDVEDALNVVDIELQQVVAEDPSLSNEAKRKSALERLRRESLEFQNARHALHGAKGEVEREKSELDRLSDERRAAEYTLQGSFANQLAYGAYIHFHRTQTIHQHQQR